MDATLDEALDILHRTGPEFGGGLSNHGPMAVETILAMGRPDTVMLWVERYVSRLAEHPEASRTIEPGQWRDALGDVKRTGDWIAFFDHELAAATWQDVGHRWVPHLTPGLMAAATLRRHAYASTPSIRSPGR